MKYINKNKAYKKKNNEIKANLVRVYINKKSLGIISLKEALNYAKKEQLDLIEINSIAVPPICKIMNYEKFLYQESKLKKLKNKNKQKKLLKEIRIRSVIDKGDYKVKFNKIVKFLKLGNKIKITIKFKGRELSYYKTGFNIFEKIKKDLQDIIKINIEYYSKFLDNSQLIMIISPINKK